jgi:hypothetical protein
MVVTKRFFERLNDKFADIRFLTPPRACDIENRDRIVGHERSESIFAPALPCVRMQPGLLMLLRKIYGLLGSAAQSWRDRKEHCTVRIAYVPFGPLEIGCRSRFPQGISVGDRTIFGFSTLRAPPTAWKLVRQRPVQGGAIGAGLSTRNDFWNTLHKIECYCGSWKTSSKDGRKPRINSSDSTWNEGELLMSTTDIDRARAPNRLLPADPSVKSNLLALLLIDSLLDPVVCRHFVLVVQLFSSVRGTPPRNGVTQLTVVLKRYLSLLLSANPVMQPYTTLLSK